MASGDCAGGLLIATLIGILMFQAGFPWSLSKCQKCFFESFVVRMDKFGVSFLFIGVQFNVRFYLED